MIDKLYLFVVTASLWQLKQKFYRICPLCDVSVPAGELPWLLCEIGFHADRLSAVHSVSGASGFSTARQLSRRAVHRHSVSLASWLQEQSRDLPQRSRPCHEWGGLSPAFDRRVRRSILDDSMCDLWWTKWHWQYVLPQYLGFSLSVSFHQCSYSFILHLRCSVLPVARYADVTRAVFTFRMSRSCTVRRRDQGGLHFQYDTQFHDTHVNTLIFTKLTIPRFMSVYITLLKIT
jgi:hypothetical protein